MLLFCPFAVLGTLLSAPPARGSSFIQPPLGPGRLGVCPELRGFLDSEFSVLRQGEAGEGGDGWSAPAPGMQCRCWLWSPPRVDTFAPAWYTGPISSCHELLRVPGPLAAAVAQLTACISVLFLVHKDISFVFLSPAMTFWFYLFYFICCHYMFTAHGMD